MTDPTRSPHAETEDATAARQQMQARLDLGVPYTDPTGKVWAPGMVLPAFAYDILIDAYRPAPGLQNEIDADQEERADVGLLGSAIYTAKDGTKIRTSLEPECVHGYVRGDDGRIIGCPHCETVRVSYADTEPAPDVGLDLINPGAIDVAETWNFSYTHGAAIYHLLCSRTLLDSRQEHLKQARRYLERLIEEEPTNGIDEGREDGQGPQEGTRRSAAGKRAPAEGGRVP